MPKSYSKEELATAKQALQQACENIKRKSDLKVGQLARWKEGMKNRRRPAYSEPVIVLDLLEAPVYDKKADEEAGSAYFREPLDLIAGLFSEEDGAFLLFHYDKRRFEPYPS